MAEHTSEPETDIDSVIDRLLEGKVASLNDVKRLQKWDERRSAA